MTDSRPFSDCTAQQLIDFIKSVVGNNDITMYDIFSRDGMIHCVNRVTCEGSGIEAFEKFYGARKGKVQP